jgi:hypothetical protein
MKYIISKEQHDKLLEIIWKYLDENFTPGRGWETKVFYKGEAQVHDEIFFMFDKDAEEWGDDAHMWYSVCDNHNLERPIREGYCPLITINSAKYDSLDGYFGPRWQEVFKKWFTKHTGLRVKAVERQDW